MEKLADSGDHRLLTRVRELLEKFRNAIREAFARLAGEDSATAAAMRTETEDALRLIDTFIEQAKQTEEIREERLAQQSEVLRAQAEKGELESRAESAERRAERSSYKSLKGATAEEFSTLADAKQLLENGADSEEVRRRTVWFKGYDGQWRIEIDDSRMKLLPFNPDVPSSLDQLIDHKELYQAYPFLRETTVFFLEMKNANGRYNKGENSIDLNKSLVENAEKLKEALIHEIQHVIQMEEGLSVGASPSYWQKRINNKADNRSVRERKMMEEAATDIIRLNQRMPEDFGSEMWEWFEGRPTEPRGKITNWDTLEAEPDPPVWKTWDQHGEELSEKYGEDAVAEWLTLRERYENLRKNNGSTNAESLYYHTAGEIEARDVANRVNLTAEERRNTRPDIDREDVVFADGRVSYSIKVTRDMDYAEQLEQIENRTLNGSNSLYVGQAPSLVSVGFSDAPFAMNQADYRKARRKEGNNKKYSSHSVALKFFKKLPQKLNDSVIFIDNGIKITVVTDQLMPDENGKPSYVIAGVWQNQKMGNDTVNQVKSAYPLKDFTYQLLQAGKAGTLVVTNKNKAAEMLASIGVQPAEQSNILGLAKDSITQQPTGSQESDSGARETSSRKATDEDYLAAVERGDMETAQEMVDEAAKEWGAYPAENGNPRKFYHGTNSGRFTVFDRKLIGTAREGDVGFFGRGFYFAFHQGEASMYGRNVIDAYLRMKKPFNFIKELTTYNGERTSIYGASDAVFVINFAEKFPTLANNHFVEVAKKGSDSIEKISLAEFAKQFRDVYQHKEFSVQELDGYNGKEWHVYADRYTETFTGSDGKEHSFTDYHFERPFYDESSARNKLNQTYEYMSNAVYSYLHLPRMVDVIQETDFSGELQKRGYDGLVQSEQGDEAVVFNENQIKSADPVTYDDAGNVIPLSERFDEEKEDIRWSKKVTDARAELAERTVGRDELGQMLDETAKFLRQARQTVDKAEYDLWIQNLRTGGRLPQRGQLLKVVRQYNDPKLTGISNEALADRIIERLAVMTDNRTIPVLYQSINRPDNPNRSVGRIHKNKYRQHPIWC